MERQLKLTTKRMRKPFNLARKLKQREIAEKNKKLAEEKEMKIREGIFEKKIIQEPVPLGKRRMASSVIIDKRYPISNKLSNIGILLARREQSREIKNLERTPKQYKFSTELSNEYPNYMVKKLTNKELSQIKNENYKVKNKGKNGLPIWLEKTKPKKVLVGVKLPKEDTLETLGLVRTIRTKSLTTPKSHIKEFNKREAENKRLRDKISEQYGEEAVKRFNKVLEDSEKLKNSRKDESE